MKKLLQIALTLFVFVPGRLHAQQAADQGPALKYRRSSLDMVLIKPDNFPQKETVVAAYQRYHDEHFPEKYNNHSTEAELLDPAAYPVTEAEMASAGVKKNGFFKNVGNDFIKKNIDKNIEENAGYMPAVINKFITTNKLANKLVAKWFNRQANGAFDMDLVAGRGYYSATEMEANIAKSTVRGRAALADAGEELINNTFVVFTKIQFISNEAAANVVTQESGISKLSPFFAKKFNDKIKEGYSVWTTTYLYKLKWNDSIADTFYKQYWMDKKNLDPKKRAAFDETNLFQLEYVGSARSSTLVTFKLQSRTPEQIVTLATIRNQDAVFAKLQKSFEVFKPKTPLYSGDPITAKIGAKEGLAGGQKFEVLEQVLDQQTGRTSYVRKGVITVNKNAIWDNRYNAGEETDPGDQSEENAKTSIDRTTFNGASGKYYAGMLIRELK